MGNSSKEEFWDISSIVQSLHLLVVQSEPELIAPGTEQLEDIKWRIDKTFVF
jgi:hypothetical protein